MKERSRAMSKSQWPTLSCRLLYKFFENERKVRGNDKITMTCFVLQIVLQVCWEWKKCQGQWQNHNDLLCLADCCTSLLRMKERSRAMTKSQWSTLPCRLLHKFVKNERKVTGNDKITITCFVLQIVIQVCWEWKKGQGKWQDHSDLLCLADCYISLLRMKEMSRAMTRSQWPTLSCSLLYKFIENERHVKGNDKITMTYFVLQIVVKFCWQWETCQGQWQGHCDLLCLADCYTRLLRMKNGSRAMSKSLWPLLSCRLLYKFVENERKVKGNDQITMTYFVVQIVLQVCWEWKKCQGQWQNHIDIFCLADWYASLLRMKEKSRAMSKSQWPTLSCRLLNKFVENERNVKGNEIVTVQGWILTFSGQGPTGSLTSKI